MCMVPFFFFFLSVCLYGKQNQKNERGEKTSGCSASSISCLNPRRLQNGLHMNTLGGIGRNQGKWRKVHFIRKLVGTTAPPFLGQASSHAGGHCRQSFTRSLHQVSFTQLMYRLVMYVLSVEVDKWRQTSIAIG